MKNDRYLISFAVLFLFLQLVWLANEMQWIQISFLNSKNKKNETWVVGKIVNVHNNVRRRHLNDFVWNEGKAYEEVKAFDALLTLKNSTTKVQLLNGAELNLSENTLVYLEPLKDEEKDQRIRIRFAHGSIRSKLNLKDSDFQTDSWVISPKAGADFQLKSFDNGKVEIELSKGSLSATQNGQDISITEGEILTLSNEKNEDAQKTKIDQKLQWKIGKNKYHRLYSHFFPTEFKLSWQGEAQKIHLYQNNKIENTIDVLSTDDNQKISLNSGSYELRLEGPQGLSNWLTLDVWAAPVIHLMSPLPRDRFQVGENLKYIWLNPKNIVSYVWELDPLATQTLNSNDYIYSAEKTGQYSWRVIGKDEEGFEIPAPYSNQIYFVQKPLDAPELNAPLFKNPELRKPANKEPEKKKDGAGLFHKKMFLFEKLFLLFSKSYAEEDEFDQSKHLLRLSWTTVQNADHYILEISETPDFRNPLVERKVPRAQFDWDLRNLKSKTFYWRVASGAKTKMGRFSQVQEVNIAKLRVGRSTNGVSIINVPTIQPEPAPEFQDKKEPQDPEVPDILADTETLLSVSFNFDQSISTDAQGTSFKYSGPTLKFRYLFDTNLENQYRFGGMATLQVNSWKNLDQDSIMLGQSYSEFRSKFIGWFGKRKSPWVFAFGFALQDFPSRSGLETAVFTSNALINAGVLYDLANNSYFRGKTGLLFSSGSTLSEAAFLYHGAHAFKQSEKIEMYWGPDLELTSFQTKTGIKGNRYQLGILLGMRW